MLPTFSLRGWLLGLSRTTRRTDDTAPAS